VLGLECVLNIENTGRRFWRAEGELRGAGDDGGLDRGGSSEKTAGESFGLDVGGVEVSRVRDEILAAGDVAIVFKISVLVLSVVVPTRLRLVGGSSS
jgi:hypothetical protein